MENNFDNTYKDRCLLLESLVLSFYADLERQFLNNCEFEEMGAYNKILEQYQKHFNIHIHKLVK